MHRNLLAVATVASAVVLLTACESMEKSSTQPSSQPAMGMLNDTCPMSGMKANPNATVSYMGYEVGFCGQGCASTWSKKTHDEKMAYIGQYTK